MTRTTTTRRRPATVADPDDEDRGHDAAASRPYFRCPLCKGHAAFLCGPAEEPEFACLDCSRYSPADL